VVKGGLEGLVFDQQALAGFERGMNFFQAVLEIAQAGRYRAI
jgi:hypothetical protein